MSQNKNIFVLAGDIGGTKTNLGLFTQGKTRPLAKFIKTYSSREARDFTSIIGHFFDLYPADVNSACFGIAGPVADGRCKITNLSWGVSETEIRRRFNWPRVRLINDLVATAIAIPLLNRHELFALNRARFRKGRNIGIVAPGTGLGQALLMCRKGVYWPVASEGGHADFAPGNDEEIKLWQYLHRRYGHVSLERVLSGQGLVNIYKWLKSSQNFREPSWLSGRMKRAEATRVITEAAFDKKDPLCMKSIQKFVSICGAVAGNLALTGMTTGGVYLGGGMSPAILPIFR